MSVDGAHKQTLPGSLGAIESVAGREAALAIAFAYRDREQLHTPHPRHLAGTHPLAALIGEPAARALAARFGGSTLHIPRASRDLVMHLSAEGRSSAETARTLGLSRRTVRRYRRGGSGPS